MALKKLFKIKFPCEICLFWASSPAGRLRLSYLRVNWFTPAERCIQNLFLSFWLAVIFRKGLIVLGRWVLGNRWDVEQNQSRMKGKLKWNLMKSVRVLPTDMGLGFYPLTSLKVFDLLCKSVWCINASLHVLRM